MTTQQIFGLQVLLSFVLYTLVARWYVGPRLAALPVDRALQPLLVLHATRHMGLVFLVPTVVGGVLPAAFAAAAAYGDLLAGVLALGALVALRVRARGARPLTWIFNIVGLLDLVNAFYQGLSHNVQLGAAYYIPTFVVPALAVTHTMIFRILLRRPAAPAGVHLPAPSHV
ncbi:MAG TPA: hypothetical protein VFO08_00415 [Methylomirabilota bacterium]|nr:hypothetical protein [Methylomirabilota bacterium]